MPRNLGHKDALLLCLGRNVVLDSCAYYDGQNQGFDVRFPKPKVGGAGAAVLCVGMQMRGHSSIL